MRDARCRMRDVVSDLQGHRIKDSLNPALTSDVCIYASGSPIPPGPSAALG